jgi:hypothetical protein
VLRGDVELAMVAAEPAQVVLEAFRVLEVLDRGHDRSQQSGALDVHVYREEVTYLRVGKEDPGVEVSRDPVLMLFDESPALLQQSRQVAAHAFQPDHGRYAGVAQRVRSRPNGYRDPGR